MAQVLHQRATTTHAIREDIQRSTESVATLSRRYGINPKTVRKWRSRTSVEVVRMGPKAARSTSLTRSSLHRLYQRHGTSQRPSSLSVFPLHREILTTVIAELRRSP